MFENLESRRLMTTTLDDSGILTIQGAEGDDDVMVWQPLPAVMRVEHNGAVAEFGAEQVKGISIDLGDGDDQVILGRRKANATIHGGAGNDSLSAGEGDDEIHGGAGDDYLFGRGGNDTLDGGDGTGDSDADDMLGGDGIDTVDYSNRTTPVRVGLGVNSNDGAPDERDNTRDDIEIAIGGAGNDELHSFGVTSVALIGNGGDDLLIGSPENDLLVGGAGHDELNGAGGFDSYLARDGEVDVVIFGTGLTQLERDVEDDVRAE